MSTYKDFKFKVYVPGSSISRDFWSDNWTINVKNVETMFKKAWAISMKK